MRAQPIAVKIIESVKSLAPVDLSSAPPDLITALEMQAQQSLFIPLPEMPTQQTSFTTVPDIQNQLREQKTDIPAAIVRLEYPVLPAPRKNEEQAANDALNDPITMDAGTCAKPVYPHFSAE